MTENSLSHEELGALSLAQAQGWLAKGRTYPNPPVGAVIIDHSGAVIGTGHTQPTGGAHAEVQALRMAGTRARGATAVVTLEPCSHSGRTGPCTQALLDAGIAKVIFAFRDPNPLAAAGGEVLKQSGMNVVGPLFQLHGGPLETPDSALLPWLFAQINRRATVTVKIASSLDGRIAAADGTSQWITSAKARSWAHLDRSQRSMIGVGTGTVIADRPTLSARCDDPATVTDFIHGLGINPENLDTSDAEYFSHAEHTGYYPHQPDKIVFGSTALSSEDTANLGNFFTSSQCGTTLGQQLEDLFSQGCVDLLIDGGPGLVSSLIETGYADFLDFYQDSTVLGSGQTSVNIPSFKTLTDKIELTALSTKQLGTTTLNRYAFSQSEEGRTCLQGS